MHFYLGKEVIISAVSFRKDFESWKRFRIYMLKDILPREDEAGPNCPWIDEEMQLFFIANKIVSYEKNSSQYSKEVKLERNRIAVVRKGEPNKA